MTSLLPHSLPALGWGILFLTGGLTGCSPASDSAPSGAASEQAMPGRQPDAPPGDIATPLPSPRISDGSSSLDALPKLIPQRFQAIGTEPFWSARVSEGSLVYSTPDNPEGARVATMRRASGDGIVVSATIDGKPLELEVTRQPCSDGMSDTAYPFAVVRRLGPDIQRGCAR